MKKKIFCFMLALSMLISVPSSATFAFSNSLRESQAATSKNIYINSVLDSNSLEIKQKHHNLIKYMDTKFNKFKLDKDIEYKQAINYAGKTEKLLLDVYSPLKNSDKKRPVIIWVHGGALSIGSKDDEGAFNNVYSKEFAQKGYVTVNINYRLNPNVNDGNWSITMKNAMEDVVSSIEWVKENSEKYNIDRNNIILAGYSAGAELITNLVYGTYVNGWDRSGISAIVDISGSNLVWGDALKNTPPCTIIHGTADNVNPFKNSEAFVKQLTASNIKYELNPIKGRNHLYKKGTEDFSNLIPEKRMVDKIEKIISKFLFRYTKENNKSKIL